MPPAKKWLGVAAVNLLTLTALVLAAEAVARWLCHEDFDALFPRPDSGGGFAAGAFVEPHPTRGYALVPLFDDGEYHVNRLGYRGPEPPEDAGSSILALGDSTTFGWGVAEGEDYPSRLSESLGGVHVVNGGVPGYTSGQTRVQLREILEGDETRPDLLLVSVLWNDIWHSSVVNWHPGILVRQPPRFFQRWLLESSGLYRCVLISRIADEGLVDIFNEDAFETYLSNLEDIFQAAREHDVPLLLVDPPFAGEKMPEQGLNRFHIRYTREFFAELARRHLAAAEEIAEDYGVARIPHRLSIDRSDPSLFLDPLHPTAEGNEALARDIASFLTEGRILEAD